MEMIGYGKSAIWTGITVLLSLLDANVIAQQGFLSIDCGGKTNHTDENNITWITDANYIHVGEIADNGNSTSPSYLQTLRFFPKPLNKSCYQLPVAPDVPYLLRLQFSRGNYSRFSGSYVGFDLTIETSGMLFSRKESIDDTATYINEGIYVSSGTVLYVCLIKTFHTDDPFINTIELRALRKGMYEQAKPGTALILSRRRDVGGNSLVRYPRDNFDRIWDPDSSPFDASDVRKVSSQQHISSKNTDDFPPSAVLQTAWALNVDNITFGVGGTTSSYGILGSLLLLYFAEIDTLNISEPRSFYVSLNGEKRSDIVTMVPNASVLEQTFVSNEIACTCNNFDFSLVKATDSNSPAIINAYELYWLSYTGTATYSQDFEALEAMKNVFDIKLDWVSDPCFGRPWKGIGCDNISSSIRISEINLSGTNFTTPALEYIGQLTALVNLSLDNNHLIGSFPNISSLTRLERLHLQNNNLTGNIPVWLFELKNLKELSLDNNNLIGPLQNFSSFTMLEILHLQNNRLSGNLPDWLFKLENLTELFIQNNNFSGVIPADLVEKSSLNVKLSGNNDLCVLKAGECVREIQETRNNNNSKSVVLGITISGCLIIALALMVGIAVYWRKKRETQRLNQDFSLTLTKLTNFRAFTGKEMVEATDDFSRQIGQGASGSVFSGKLREENDILIAVKVLSSLHQFLNEVAVISRAQHENLVSLVGYCSESKNLMLIYEYMSGGSLWRSLHDTSAGHSNLNWKTRLNIALDVANGLEFLHVGCTPKIIHMDVKTANILLDSNKRAKLADFGLSRIATDGEASHATMTTANGTPGYIDPEYRLTHRVTEKSDVYSFGVVLFEIISGKRVINANDEEEFSLVEWVTPKVRNEDVDAEIIDERLAGNYDKKSIVRVAKVALRCVKDSSFSRPSISEVVGEIKEAIIDETENNAQFPVSEEIGIEH